MQTSSTMRKVERGNDVGADGVRDLGVERVESMEERVAMRLMQE